MLPNDDLARWGEPPADENELALANRLADALAPDRPDHANPDDSFHGAPADVTAIGLALVEVAGLIEQMISTVLERAGVFAAPLAGTVELGLRVLRDAGGGRFVAVASTHPAATLRDLRRVPADPDRVHLRTGDRVRLEVVRNREGYLTVLNVGPQGALHLLHPAEGQAAQVAAADTPVPILDVELTPPTGRERLWAVWSRVPLEGRDVSQLVRPGARMRDMRRVQDAVARLRPEDWHAVLLEVDHHAGHA